MKRSTTIVLLLSGALATTAGLSWYQAQKEESPAEPTDQFFSSGEPNPDQELENNSYLPGSGYYHSVSHNWHPYPFNWHVPGRGYYYGGDWHASAFNGVTPSRSRPNPEAVAAARTQGFSGAASHFAHGSSAGGGSSSAGHSSFHSSQISRGGFGGSSHGGGS